MFIIMAVGFLARCAGVIKHAEVPRMNGVVFRIFMPCLVFYNIYKSDLSAAVKPGLILFTVVGVFAVYAAAVVIVRFTVPDIKRRAAVIQGIYRSNYVVIGLPVATHFVPEQELGIIMVLIAVIIPIYNGLAVITLETCEGKKVSVGKTIASILTNPLIVGAAAGIAALALKIELPEILNTAMKDVAAVATPMQLFLLGAFFSFGELGQYKSELIWTTLARLVFVPGVMLPLAAAMGFRGSEFVALIGCFASSNAVASFSMSQEMGGDASLSGDIVVLTSALCPLTVFGWTLLYKTLGVF